MIFEYLCFSYHQYGVCLLGGSETEDVQRVDGQRALRLDSRGVCPLQRWSEEGTACQDAGILMLYFLNICV